MGQNATMVNTSRNCDEFIFEIYDCFRIFFAAPLVAICYFGVWCLPDFSEGGKFAYYLAAHSLMWTFMTVSQKGIDVCLICSQIRLF